MRAVYSKPLFAANILSFVMRRGSAGLPLGPVAPVIPPHPRADPDVEERFGRQGFWAGKRLDVAVEIGLGAHGVLGEQCARGRAAGYADPAIAQ